MDLALEATVFSSSGSNARSSEKNYSHKSTKNSSNFRVAMQASSGVDGEINLNEKDEIKQLIAVRNLIKTANLKLNEIFSGNTIKRDYLTVVKVYCIFLKIGEIENIKQRFQADVYVEASWEDDQAVPGKPFDPSQYWTPEICIENAVANTKQSIKYKVEKRGDKIIVCEQRNVQSVFWEKLELEDFPLDIQDISVTVASTKSVNEVKFVLSDENECEVNTEDFRAQQEWNLYTHVNSSERIIPDVFRNYDRPAYTMMGAIARRPGYYLNNAYMLIFFITILGFVPFSFGAHTPHFRIQTILLLILSSINFKLIMTAKLPTVSYLTVFDKYILSALLFLVILCVWHAIIGSRLFLFPDPAKRISIDFIALYSIGAIYIAFHTAYIPYFLSKLIRHKQVEEEAKQEKAKKLEEINEAQIELKPLINEVALMQSQMKPTRTPPNARVSFNQQAANQIRPPNASIQGRSNLGPGQANRLGNSPQQQQRSANLQNSPNTQMQNQRINSRKSIA